MELSQLVHSYNLWSWNCGQYSNHEGSGRYNLPLSSLFAYWVRISLLISRQCTRRTREAVLLSNWHKRGKCKSVSIDRTQAAIILSRQPGRLKNYWKTEFFRKPLISDLISQKDLLTFFFSSYTLSSVRVSSVSLYIHFDYYDNRARTYKYGPIRTCEHRLSGPGRRYKQIFHTNGT